MIKIIINKAFVALLSVLMVSALIISIIFFAPIDPARLSFGQRTDEETVMMYKKKYFLDQPLLIQLSRYFEDLSPVQFISKNDLRINDYDKFVVFQSSDHLLILKKPYFRKSYTNGQLVWPQIMDAIPGTLVLATVSILISVIIGMFLGFVSAIKYETWIDKSIQVFCSISYAIPSYVSALFLAIFLAYFLGHWTGLPLQGSLWDYNDLGDEKLYLKNLILPVLALGIRPVSTICQMSRTAALDVMNADFVRTARSKGITLIKLMLSHVVPNSINPILTTISSWFASLLTGSFFVEYIFNYKGLGLLTITSLNKFDVPMITACCVITVSIFVLVNFLTDLAYTYFDPRVKLN